MKTHRAYRPSRFAYRLERLWSFSGDVPSLQVIRANAKLKK